MKTRRQTIIVPSLLLPMLLASSACFAQANVKVENKTPPGQKAGTISLSEKPSTTSPDPNPAVKFTKLGGDIARPAVAVPKDANSLLQVSAPLGTSGNESILVHVYQRADALFADILTAKGKQAWTRRNTVRFLAPLPEHPGNLEVEMHYLEPRSRRGLMLVVSDEAMHYVLAFPKGFGATVTQQQFLTTSKDGTQSTFTFNNLDGRGFAIVRGTILSAGQAKPGDDTKYFVWNGSKFIPRANN